MSKKKIDANEFWEKRELKQSWGKVLLSIFLVCFGLFYGAYCLDMYMGAHNLTFVKFKINPEFGFIVNGNDEVVHYLPLNDDARKIFNLDMFKGKKTNDAIDKAVDVAKANNYLVDEDKKIEVSVIAKDKNDKEIVENKILDVIKEKDNTVATEVVEATEEEKEIFTNIKLDKIDKVEETYKKKEEEKKVCNYTSVSSIDMSGEDRYVTAVEVSNKMYPDGSKNVVLVSGNDMIQGILSNSLASALDAPILLVEQNAIKNVVLDELVRLNVENVYVLGGSAVVSDNVINTIKSKFTVEGLEGESLVKVERIAGADRFITSIEIAQKVKEFKDVTSIILAPGDNEPIDAGMVSSFSGEVVAPIIYNKKDSLVNNVIDFIKSNKNITTIYIAGGTFTDKVIKEIENLGRSVVIIKGTDRYATNAKAIETLNKDFRSIVVVNNLVDTIVASRYSTHVDAALIYTGNTLVQQHIDLLKNKNINTIYYFGGENGMPAYRNALYNVKKANMSKCSSVVEELLFSTDKVVFYVPHQDDESSHFGRSIITAIDKLGARNVYVVVMTKGEASGVYIGNQEIPPEKDISKMTDEEKQTAYLKEPVNDNMLIKYGYVDKNGKASFMMARDAEFRNAMKALGVPESNYKFAEELVGLEGLTHTDRFQDKGVAGNINHVKNIMKYYDKELTKNNKTVTHITYTFLDGHSDHNSLGKALTELHYDSSLDNKEFENVYLIMKNNEVYNVDDKLELNLTNGIKYTAQLNAFKAYQMDLDNNILGVGYRSASGVFDEFVTAISKSSLSTPIHIPFKK